MFYQVFIKFYQVFKCCRCLPQFHHVLSSCPKAEAKAKAAAPAADAPPDYKALYEAERTLRLAAEKQLREVSVWAWVVHSVNNGVQWN